MKHSIELSSRLGCVEVARALRLCPPCTVQVGAPDSAISLDVAGLARSNWIEAWLADRWALLVGLESPEVVVVQPSKRSISVVGHLDRLDLDVGYDPGGLHRVEFHELAPDAVLVEYEFGVARVDIGAGIVWHVIHGDITTRVVERDADRVWLEGEYNRSAYWLVDGTLAPSTLT